MKERFDEWHRHNPGQMATAQMMLGILASEISPPPARTSATIATRETHPQLFKNTAGQLSAQERVEALERELFYLRGRGTDRHLRSREKEVEEEKEIRKEEEKSPEVVKPAKKSKLVPEVVIPVVTKSARPKDVEEEPASDADNFSDIPEHPFADVPDATYSAPKERNFAAPPKPNPPKKANPAYHTVAPIYDERAAETAFDKAMSTLITLTQRELFSLSPELRALVKEAVSARRNPAKSAPFSSDDPKDIHVLATDADIAFALDDLEPDDSALGDMRLPTQVFAHAIRQPRPPPPDAIIIPDIYDTYLKSLPQGHVAEPLIVAKESSALRSIFPVINNQTQVEAILDPGSQIIAMSEDVCIDLALPYDPAVILTMQSANGEVDQSLGLARNIPLCIAGITLYVQIHVI
jgi:hypothetical protein